MATVLVIGASGFVGRRLAVALLAAGYTVRCLARDPAGVADLGRAGCDIVQGDMLDADSISRAAVGVNAIYLSVHTLSKQPDSSGGRFMDAERQGVANVITAVQGRGVRRVIYVTSIGVSPDGPGEWLRECCGPSECSSTAVWTRRSSDPA
jgi:uncharacterized protein YbjT (DUF2867 family)